MRRCLGSLLGGIKLGVCGQFDSPLLALGFGYLRTAGPFGVELLQHRIARRLVEVDVEDLSPRDLDAPVIDGILNKFFDPRD